MAEPRRGASAGVLLAIVGILVVGFLYFRGGDETGRTADADAGAESGDRSGAGRGSRTAAGSSARRATPRRLPGAGGPGPGPLRTSPATVTEDPTATEGVVSGLVISFGSGTPVADAELTFAYEGATLSVVTGPGGTFEFVPPTSGRYELSFATAPGHLPYGPEWGHSPVAFHLRRGLRLSGVRVVLIPEIEYVGVVIDGEGEPVPDAQIELLGATSEQAMAPLQRRFVSDGRGVFRFKAPDGAVLEARHTDKGVGRAALGFEAQVSKHLVIQLIPDWKDTARAQLAGTVLDGDGSPVDGALVSAVFEVPNRALPGANLLPPAQATTEGDGSFTLVGLDEGTYTLTASAEGHARTRLEGVRSGSRDAVLQLSSELTLQGSVSGADGAPVPSFSVVVERPAGAIERTVATVASIYDGEGNFEVGGLSEGPYLVTVTAHDHAPSDAIAVELPSTTPLRVTLSAGGSIVGRVTSGEAGPVSGARVSLESNLGGGSSPVPLVTTDVTDDTGSFELKGVASGIQSIMVAAEGHHGRILSGLSVPASGELRVNVQLTPTAEGEVPRLELAGIGAVLTPKDDVLLIGQVIDGGGAAEVGLTAGDAVLAVDGTPVAELGYTGSIQAIRGPEGSTVRLKVRRADGTEQELEVRRRQIRT